jgi:hypothetical protein
MGNQIKKHKRGSGDGFSALTLAFSQFAKSSNEIETMEMELQSQMTKEAMEVQESICQNGHGDEVTH